MKDWRAIAGASDLGISEADADRIAPVLEKLDAALGPLVRSLTPEVEPCSGAVTADDNE